MIAVVVVLGVLIYVTLGFAMLLFIKIHAMVHRWSDFNKSEREFFGFVFWPLAVIYWVTVLSFRVVEAKADEIASSRTRR